MGSENALSGGQAPPVPTPLFTVLIRYLRPLPEVDRVAPEHRSYLGEIFRQGHLVASGPMVPRTGGILWIRAPHREAVERIVADDPYARAKVAAFEILEFDPKTVLPALLS
ncbi:MAG: YciI family protein [Nitrospirae bacterium]|nr:YciI family protein [Nitrospirota bacterium]